MELEFPAGSGRKADYTQAERDMMKSVLAIAESEGRSSTEIIDELTILHDLKMEFGIDLVEDDLEE